MAYRFVTVAPADGGGGKRWLSKVTPCLSRWWQMFGNLIFSKSACVEWGGDSNPRSLMKSSQNPFYKSMEFSQLLHIIENTKLSFHHALPLFSDYLSDSWVLFYFFALTSSFVDLWLSGKIVMSIGDHVCFCPPRRTIVLVYIICLFVPSFYCNELLSHGLQVKLK